MEKILKVFFLCSWSLYSGNRLLYYYIPLKLRQLRPHKNKKNCRAKLPYHLYVNDKTDYKKNVIIYNKTQEE